jgi:hypothetical protein
MCASIIDCPANPERVVAARLAQEALGHAHRLARGDLLDRDARGDGAEERQVDGPRLRLVRQDLDRAALVVRALDVALPLEVAQVFVHRRQRVIVELLGDLLEARREAVARRVRAEVGEDLALALRERHGASAGEPGGWRDRQVGGPASRPVREDGAWAARTVAELR